ncbi:MAG: hypothetical protein E7256_05240 [Lachnospiraceae bacterium]|nr:hypothetical protein [Lachnospiraceae bacterium]
MRGNIEKQSLQKKTFIRTGTIVLGVTVLAGCIPAMPVNALEPAQISVTKEAVIAATIAEKYAFDLDDIAASQAEEPVSKNVTYAKSSTKDQKEGNQIAATAKEEDASEVTEESIQSVIDPGIPISSNNARYQYLFGTNYKAFTIYDPPKGYESASKAAKNMTTITVPVWKMNASGKKYKSSYELTINRLLADNVAAIFQEIYELNIKFPIKVMSGYRYRKVGGVGLSNSTLLSVHSFGAAIDINYGDYDNDYYLGDGNDLRDKTNSYCIPDEVIAVFEKYGWYWGGDFSICSDTMHFQYLGLDFLTYQDNSPFRTLTTEGAMMSGKDVKNLQQRLKKLGFSVSVDGVYGNATAKAVKKAQKRYGLKATGVVDYKTWETIINQTHDMSYVF